MYAQIQYVCDGKSVVLVFVASWSPSLKMMKPRESQQAAARVQFTGVAPGGFGAPKQFVSQAVKVIVAPAGASFVE